LKHKRIGGTGPGDYGEEIGNVLKYTVALQLGKECRAHIGAHPSE